ncbi:unnamed protein product [Lota lota]
MWRGTTNPETTLRRPDPPRAKTARTTHRRHDKRNAPRPKPGHTKRDVPPDGARGAKTRRTNNADGRGPRPANAVPPRPPGRPGRTAGPSPAPTPRRGGPPILTPPATRAPGEGDHHPKEEVSTFHRTPYQTPRSGHCAWYQIPAKLRRQRRTSQHGSTRTDRSVRMSALLRRMNSRPKNPAPLAPHPSPHGNAWRGVRPHAPASLETPPGYRP